MYISKVSLKTSDTYEQHQAIWSLFPNSPERKRDHLFRVEAEQNGQILLLLQSSSAPISSDRATVIQSKALNIQLTNPTKCLSKGKKVIEIKEEAEQVAWLQRKLNGANVTVTALESKLVKSKKTFYSRFVCFEGIIQITNSEQIYSALIMGIGRKKHAGAGLLSLAKTA